MWPPAWPRDRWLAAAAALVALVEAALLLRGVAPVAASTPAEGHLRVDATSPGSEVIVDGRARGVAPLALQLAHGPHRVEVRQGAAVRRFVAQVPIGGESHHFVDIDAARPASGTGPIPPAGARGTSLAIASEPAGARVAIDGRPRGASPIVVRDLAPGLHDIVLTGAGGSVTRRVRVEEGAASSVVVVMPKPGSGASGWAKVKLPIVAEIYKDGDLLGTTDVDRLMLPAGSHKLRLVNRDLRFELNQVIQIAPGQTRVVEIAVPKGLLSVNALPWAQVWIDGEARGETPIGNLAVPIGVHEIVLRHPELGEQRRRVTVPVGGVTRLGVDLRR
ncbi:MAG TPA: PEGA domain-containing protein [Vicinamibacterales bacterium]|nr:PEGA domain-containing protein [Vicinamibacterales bacterium]